MFFECFPFQDLLRSSSQKTNLLVILVNVDVLSLSWLLKNLLKLWCHFDEHLRKYKASQVAFFSVSSLSSQLASHFSAFYIKTAKRFLVCSAEQCVSNFFLCSAFLNFCNTILLSEIMINELYWNIVYRQMTSLLDWLKFH